ncbi:MAG: TfoX/Sxy family protein [Nitrospinales bacterium]
MTEKISHYNELLEKIFQECHPKIIDRYLITYKSCFGAIAGYTDGKIFCSLGKFGFALKLPPSELKDLHNNGCRPLKYFPNGHIKKDYAILSKSVMENKAKISRLIKMSVKFATK